jgi:hypothetical protein
MKPEFWKLKITGGIGNTRKSANMACLINPMSPSSLDICRVWIDLMGKEVGDLRSRYNLGDFVCI